jgi:hypothetical protein
LSKIKVSPLPSQDAMVNDLLAALEIHAQTLAMCHLHNEVSLTSVEVGRLMSLETMTQEGTQKTKL